jgi:hypothetical protein
MTTSKSFLKIFGVKDKKEEFTAFSLIKSFEKSVAGKVTELKDRDSKLDVEIKKVKSKLKELEDEKTVIKTLLENHS